MARKNTANLLLIKEMNLSLLFGLVYRNGPISRAALAERTKLSPTTVSSLIEVLMEREIVVEIGEGQTATSGRKPILVQINAGGAYLLAYELVENGFKCHLYNLLCEKITGLQETIMEFEHLGRDMGQAAERLLKVAGAARERLLGIAIGAPGLVDCQNQRVLSSTVVPIDARNQFHAALKEAFPGLPVLLENDSCLCAYAEKEFGKTSSDGYLVYIDINNGVGAGILIGGKLYRGADGFAGEVGHVTIDIHGPRCRCGNRGCLEVMAGVPAMVQLAVLPIFSGRDTRIKEMVGNDLNRINADVIGEAARAGDNLAMEIVEEMALRLSHGVNTVVNLFNPRVVAIGGAIAKLGEPFIRLVKENLKGMALSGGEGGAIVKYADIRDDAALLGGAKYLLDTVFGVQPRQNS